MDRLFDPVLSALALAFIFYIAIPLTGAFRVRANWRAIRRRLQAARKAREWKFEYGSKAQGPLGYYRIEGAIEAIQGQDRLWARCIDSSVVVEPGRHSVLTLPQGDPLAGEGETAALLELADERIDRSAWEHLGALVEGTRILAWGEVAMESGVPVLRGLGKDTALVLVHDGADEHALPRAIWAARHRNEYWNPATQLSLAAGIVAMSALAGSAILRSAPTFIVAATLTIAFAPALPLAPPGLPALFAYRWLWNSGRVSRARRDIRRLEGRIEEAAAQGRAATYLQALAGLVFIAGFTLNAVLAYLALRALLR